ncbi:hypothetical protein H310_02444 [Aphanomyces invadans]|uniref:WRKY19-like zinc finger domain-containing protein n=1 Tax=Aphanomyces invadans TaxID=157072 RepID=A0A024UP46_9STRA|nr:hypothetical protein H310_02444 [Aphanomyces invadans]ETW08079.1 hypothetical protein H310_02444 [Aphanomyces invadans]|eukprot:XP_008864172.1 hypothetical protein H310_02444 [Aphanomyces invadans]
MPIIEDKTLRPPAMSKLSLAYILHSTQVLHITACEGDVKSPSPLKTQSQQSAKRRCRMPDCDSAAISQGVCIRHGGGPRCSVAGCRNGAKSRRLCWKHGGSTKCTISSCNNRSKARGLCWSHGGGKPCSAKYCSLTALSRGLCWAHGGGMHDLVSLGQALCNLRVQTTSSRMTRQDWRTESLRLCPAASKQPRECEVRCHFRIPPTVNPVTCVGVSDLVAGSNNALDVRK